MAVGVSVLICTRDRSAMLEECLRSVLDCAPAPAEVIVVDQSRGEETRLVVCKYQGGPVPVRYLRSGKSGLSRAKNHGIADCTADIIATTDDDCRVERNWIGALTSPLAAGRASAAVGRTLPAPSENGAEETFSVYRPPSRKFSRRTHPWRVGGGGNFAVLRSAILEVGPFDERFGPGAPFESAEDMDLVHRLLRKGHEIVYVSEAIVHHRSWRGEGENRRLSRRYGIGAGGYFVKHLAKGDLLSGWRFCQRAGVRSLNLMTGALRGDTRRVTHQAEYLKGLFEGAVRYLSQGSRPSSSVSSLEKERA